MALIRDLLHFEEIEAVIKIGKDEKAQENVENYVISESLRNNLSHMLEIMSGSTHKSFNIVGNYGTGKSHFIAFVAAILEHPDYRVLIKDAEIAKKAEGLDRRYLVVKFELGATQGISLRRIFFEQIKQQLLERYDIDVRAIDLNADYDNKKNVLNILSDIKAADPEAGLVVIVDEISDFLKQKTKPDMAYDLALLRELGEISQESDFLYFGTMQEHVFTDPKYVDQAESVARINQRYVTITITKDDVSQVLTHRVLRKDADQKLQLEGILSDYRKYFPNFAAQSDKYIDLFPIHPYVIDVFEGLPYFENRGIITFSADNVKLILDQPAPLFITYDRVYDLIDAVHEIRNQPTVAEVIKVIQALQSKIDLLDARFREDAKKLIKALAVLKLLGGVNKNGATSQELANTLMITPPGKMLVEPEMARDNIERIMKNIREVTVGQYIDYGEGRYFLNLTKVDDYDAYIEQKAQAVVVGNTAEIEKAFRDYALSELGLKEKNPFINGKAIYGDTTTWTTHRSFRPGLMVIGRDEGIQAQYGDYRFTLHGPTGGKIPAEQNALTLTVDFPNELTAKLVRARAAELLANDNVHKKVMLQLSKDAIKEFGEAYLSLLVSKGGVQFAGHKIEMAKLPSQRPLNNLADIVEHVKSQVLEDTFAEKYKKYPVFNTLLTEANLPSEVTRTLQSLERQATVQLDMNSQGYLTSFGAYKDNHFSTSGSEMCQLILARIEANDKINKVTSVEELTNELAREPWGLQRELVYLLLGTLLFNGYLIFVRQGGARLHASDVSPLIKNGLDFFNDIRYLERDKDIDVEAVAAIFNMLGLQAGLVRDKDSRSDAVKELRKKGLELKEKLTQVRQAMQSTVVEGADHPDIPSGALQEALNSLAALEKPVNEFSEVSKVADFGKLETSPEILNSLKGCLRDLGTLDGFLHDWRDESLGSGLSRMNQAVKLLPALSSVASKSEKTTISELERIAIDSKAIYADIKQLLDSNQRRPLKGKLEQFRNKYDTLYYNLHRRMVGEDAPWAQLAEIRQGARYAALNQLKSLPFISSAPFNQLALEITSLDRKRCRDFSALTLTIHVSCPYCRFPEEGQSLIDLPKRVEDIHHRLDDLWEAWGTQIINELPVLKNKLGLLPPGHRKEIEQLQRTGKIPDNLSNEMIAALFDLTSDLQAIEIDLYALGEYLVDRGSALTEDEMRTALDEYLITLLKGHDRSLVRFKIVHKEKE
jgi:hypothetical protein